MLLFFYIPLYWIYASRPQKTIIQAIRPATNLAGSWRSDRELEPRTNQNKDNSGLSNKMPALDSLAIATQKQILERRNWASREPGPILVFCIVFIVGMGIILLFLYRQWMAHRARQENYA